MLSLRRARAPQSGFPLSGVVHVRTAAALGVSYVKFGEDVLRVVGRLLPDGVAPYRKAYLSLVEWPDGSWHLYAQYVSPPVMQVEVEAYDSAPKWLKIIRR